MRAGLIFDPHVSDKSPSTRKDDYRNAILRKLEFCIEEANKRRYSFLVIAGDLFHRKIPAHNSHAMVSSLMSIFKQSRCPVLVIAGNHDISGNLVNIHQQPLYVLATSGVIQILDDSKPVTFREEDGFTVSVNGLPFSAQRDNKDAGPLYNLQHAEADCRIGVFHQMILPDGMTFFNDYINFSDLLQVNSDIIVDGHYHVGFNPSVVEFSGKYFINGGALSRGSSEQFNLDKQPVYIELNLTRKIDGGFILQTEDILVPHTPSKEAFDMVAIKRHKETKEMKEFIAQLNEFEAESLSSQTPDGVLRILSTMGMPEKLLPTAEEYLILSYENLAR